jgi:mono/diheme cytochrome c family protein
LLATGALLLNVRATSSWPAARTLTPNLFAACTASNVREPRSRQASINIGWSESDATALAVAPAGPSAPVAVTTVTPVGSRLIAARNCSGSTRDIREYDARGVRPVRTTALATAAVAALGFAGCDWGKEGISVSADDPNYEGAVLFATRCSGCHTLAAAGSQGTGNRGLRTQGPNLDQRTETFEDVLFAIQNGGFSGAIMPQNIVVGEEAEAVARFVAKYAGSEAQE